MLSLVLVIIGLVTGGTGWFIAAGVFVAIDVIILAVSLTA